LAGPVPAIRVVTRLLRIEHAARARFAFIQVARFWDQRIVFRGASFLACCVYLGDFMFRLYYRRVFATVLAVGLIVPLAVRAETPLSLGKYLMQSIVACGNCHTPKGSHGSPVAGMELAGGFTINAPEFDAVASNITPDKDTGIGRWTDQQIIDAIRMGKRPDGSLIGPPMPIAFYRGMSDTDVKALVAYLRSVKPVHNVVAKSTYRIPLPPSYGSPVTHVPDVSRSDKVAYGRYLTTGLGHCMDCHTPLVKGRNDMTRFGAGGNMFGAPGGGVIASPNLTPANPNGIAHWTDAQVKAAITDGKRPDRHLVPLMAFDWYKHMTNADLDDLVAFLRSLKPVKSQ
jgi:mono/diheme cytochrome c family protein